MGESALCRWRCQSLDSPQDVLGEGGHWNKDRKKVTSTKQFRKAKAHSPGGRGAGFRRRSGPYVVWGLDIFCITLSWEELWQFSGVLSNAGYFQSFGELFPPVGRGSFWPYNVCTRIVLAAFFCGFVGWGWDMGGRLYLQCKCIIRSLVLTLGQKWKRRIACSTLVVLDLSAPRSCKPQGQDVVLPGF